MENEIKPALLETTKEQVEITIAAYLKDHPRSDTYDYLGNFRLYLQEHPDWDPAYERRKVDKSGGTTNRETLRDPSYATSHSERWLESTKADFIKDIDKAMTYAGVTVEEITALDNLDEVRSDIQDFQNRRDIVAAKILPAYIYMVALGYNPFSELMA